MQKLAFGAFAALSLTCAAAGQFGQQFSHVYTRPATPWTLVQAVPPPCDATLTVYFNNSLFMNAVLIQPCWALTIDPGDLSGGILTVHTNDFDRLDNSEPGEQIINVEALYPLGICIDTSHPNQAAGGMALLRLESSANLTPAVLGDPNELYEYRLATVVGNWVSAAGFIQPNRRALPSQQVFTNAYTGAAYTGQLNIYDCQMGVQNSIAPDHWVAGAGVWVSDPHTGQCLLIGLNQMGIPALEYPTLCVRVSHVPAQYLSLTCGSALGSSCLPLGGGCPGSPPTLASSAGGFELLFAPANTLALLLWSFGDCRATGFGAPFACGELLPSFSQVLFAGPSLTTSGMGCAGSGFFPFPNPPQNVSICFQAVFMSSSGFGITNAVQESF